MKPHTINLRIRHLVLGSGAIPPSFDESISEAIAARVNGGPVDTDRRRDAGVSESIADAVMDRLQQHPSFRDTSIRRPQAPASQERHRHD